MKRIPTRFFSMANLRESFSPAALIEKKKETILKLNLKDSNLKIKNKDKLTKKPEL